MNEDKKDNVEQGPQGKEIFVGNDEKPSSELEANVLENIRKDQSIDIDVIMDMAIKQFETDKTLQSKYPDDLKMLRQQWNEFSIIFQKLSKIAD